MSEVTKQAIEKIDLELKDFKGGQKEKVVYKEIAQTLKQFCENEKFASAVVDKKETLTDCCKEIVKGVGNGLSDIEAYRRAANFYFPNAKIEFNMTIELSGELEVVAEAEMPKKVEEVKPQQSDSKVVAKKEKKVKSKKEDTSSIQIALF